VYLLGRFPGWLPSCFRSWKLTGGSTVRHIPSFGSRNGLDRCRCKPRGPALGGTLVTYISNPLIGNAGREGGREACSAPYNNPGPADLLAQPWSLQGAPQVKFHARSGFWLILEFSNVLGTSTAPWQILIFAHSLFWQRKRIAQQTFVANPGTYRAHQR